MRPRLVAIMLNPFKRIWGKSQPQAPEPLSQAEYESLVKDLATQASQGASWPKLLATLQNQGLTPEQVAQWMAQYGGQWVKQPETEFGQGLLQLSELANGSLAGISRILGKEIIKISTLGKNQSTTRINIQCKEENNQNTENKSVNNRNIEKSDSESPSGNKIPEEKKQSLSQTPNIRNEDSKNNGGTQLNDFQLANQLLEQANNSLKSENYEEALEAYTEALAIDPGKATEVNLNNLAAILGTLNRHEEALEKIEIALKYNSDSPGAWYNRALSLHSLDRYEEALESYDKALSIDTKSKDFKVDFAWENRGLLLDILGRHEEALDSFEKALDLNPNNPIGWHKRGLSLYRHNCHEDALFSYNKAIDVMQNPISDLWIDRGLVLDSLERHQEAVSSYDEALNIDPRSKNAWNNRGCSLNKMSLYAQAIDSFDRALKIDSEFNVAWVNKINALYQKGSYEECLKASINALNLNPRSVQIWQDRGLSLYALGAYKEALANFNQALFLDLRAAMMWNNRAAALNNLERYQESLVSCYCAIHLDSRITSSWSNLGVTFHSLGYHKEAMVSYRSALKINPKDPSVWHNRANILKATENYRESVANFDQALVLAPQAFIAWDNRGMAIAHLGSYTPMEPDIFSQSIGLGYSMSTVPCSIRVVDFYSASKALEDLAHSMEESRNQLLYQFERVGSQELIDFLQRNLSLEEFEKLFEMSLTFDISAAMVESIRPEILQEILKDAFLQPGRLKPELQIGGYQGALNSYSAELGKSYQETPDKAICKDTDPRGWGQLHLSIGRTHYAEGCKKNSPWSYWIKAKSSFKQALETLHPPKYEVPYFKAIQNLLQVLGKLGEYQEIQVLQQETSAYIQRTLEDPERSEADKKALGLWLAKFEQLTVDAAIQAGDFRKALSTAETAKNVCLRWLLDLDEVPDITFEQMQALVDEHTAMVYWHLSPAALTTFLLLPGATEPVVIPPPDLAVDPTQVLANDERPPGLKQILGWEDWLSQWNQDYDNYSSAQNKTDKQPAGFDFAQGTRWMLIGFILGRTVVVIILVPLAQPVLPTEDLLQPRGAFVVG